MKNIIVDTCNIKVRSGIYFKTIMQNLYKHVNC